MISVRVTRIMVFLAGAALALLVGFGVLSTMPREQSNEPQVFFEEPVEPEPEEPLVSTEFESQGSISVSTSCSGNARCFTGKVTEIIDGDTMRVYGQSIRFALSSTPEFGEDGGLDAKHFVEEICPVGSEVLVDEDDGQTEGSYGRIIALIYCNGFNLNEAVLDEGHAWLSSDFCSKSEFSTHYWAQNHGC